MKKFLSDEWAVIKTWWSMWAGIVTAGLLVAVPVVADHWPDLAPAFIALFPKHGQEVAPVIGVALIILARLISQAAVIEGFRRMRDRFFRRERKEGDDGAH